MEFSLAKEHALQWTEDNCIPFQLVGAIEEERRLVFSAEVSSLSASSSVDSPKSNADLHAPVSKAPGDRDGAVSTSLQDVTLVVRPCSFYVICPAGVDEEGGDGTSTSWVNIWPWHYYYVDSTFDDNVQIL